MNPKNAFSSIIICGLLLAFGAPSRGQSQTPKVLPFQGRLTDSSGKPVPDGVRLVQFQIYSEPAGENVLWAGELHRATVNGGLVNVLLGTKNALPENSASQTNKSFFQQPLYLQITVDANDDSQITAADPPSLPRQAILPVIFANEAGNARTLNGYDWTAIFASSDPGKAFISESRLPPAATVPPGGMILSTNFTPPPGFGSVGTGAVFSSAPVSVVGVASQTNRFSPTFVSTGTNIYAFGGYVDQTPVAFTERYILAQNTWERLQDLPAARQDISGVSMAGQVYAVGGLAAGKVISTRVDVFDPSNNKWTLKTQLPDTRIYAGVGADGDFIYVFGGSSRSDAMLLLDSAYRYSVQSNLWEALPKMPRAGASQTVLKIDGSLYVFAQQGSSQQYKIDVYGTATRKWTQIASPPYSLVTVSRNNLIFGLDPPRPILTEFDPVNGNVHHYWQPNFHGAPGVLFAAGSGFIVMNEDVGFPPTWIPQRFDVVPDLNVYVRSAPNGL